MDERNAEPDTALSAEANELYALAPAEFTAARNARAAEVRADDRALSDAIKALRRASPAAWVAGLVVRQRRADLDEALALGEAQRAAQDALDRGEITRLQRERRRVVTALAREGGALAAEAGHPVTTAVIDDVAETLQAAMSDPQAADALRTGRLLRALEAVGFEAVDLTDAVAASGGADAAGSTSTRRRALHAVDDADDDRVVRAVRDAEQKAEATARDAADTLEAAEARVAELRTRRAELAVELDDLEDELVATRKALSATERETRAADRERDAAERAAERALATLEKARERRQRLGR